MALLIENIKHETNADRRGKVDESTQSLSRLYCLFEFLSGIVYALLNKVFMVLLVDGVYF